MNINWCNNCAKLGHTINQCKTPITSFGCIVFRINKITKKIEYLMICRRYSIAYLDFIRGKYNINDLDNLKYIFQQMTNKERELIRCGDFNKILNTTWGYDINKLNNEEKQSLDKYNLLYNKKSLTIDIKEDTNILKETLKKHSLIYDKYLLRLIDESLEKTDIIYNYISDTIIQKLELFPKNGWDNPEWGFPKGRREYKETDYNCAIREFSEETGININLLHQIKNIVPMEENFMGTNYKTYKHKYYLMYMNYEDTLMEFKFQKTEVSCLSWKSVEKCIECIRPYNIEKKSLITNIDYALHNYVII